MNKLVYYLGNFLMLISASIFFYIAYPLVSIYLFPPIINDNLPHTGMFITIPKIHAQSPIIPQVDPWNDSAYHAALRKGVAQAKGTSLPGEPGTVFLFAHSSGPPWEQTHFNTIFVRLSELKKGDEINIVRDGKLYQYKVKEEKTVWPNEVSYLINSKQNQLILQTCTPIGTSLQRLLVFADPV